MGLLSIIVPTITGREESVKRVRAAYQATTPAPFEIISPRDYPNWPAACNVGAMQAQGNRLHFGADDLVPHDGWWRGMVNALTAREIPAAQVWDFRGKDGTRRLDSAQDGLPGSLVSFSRVPALTREMYDMIGPWPEIDYYADCWVSDKARSLGIETRMSEAYSFVHYWHPFGRLDSPDRTEKARAEYARLVAEL